MRPVVALSIAVLLLAAPAGALPTGREKDACDLLRRSEIEDVLAQGAGKPEELGIGDSSCFWELDELDGGGMTILLTRGRGAKAEYEERKDAIRPDVLVEVEGLGKDAFFALNELVVLKNKKTVLYVTGVFDQAQSEELGRIALERL